MKAVTETVDGCAEIQHVEEHGWEGMEGRGMEGENEMDGRTRRRGVNIYKQWTTDI